MRTWLWFMTALLAAAPACQDSGAARRRPVAVNRVTAPEVATQGVLAPVSGAPPFLLLVEPDGGLRLAAAASWEDLDANRLTRASQTAPRVTLDSFVREEADARRPPVSALARWEMILRAGVASDTVPAPPAEVPAPPPEEEEDLNTVDPAVARQRAIDQAREAGLLGKRPGFSYGAYASDVRPALSRDGMPARGAQITGVVVRDEPLDKLHAMIVAPPSLKARTLIELVRDTRAVLAVMHGGKLRPLRIHFERDGWVAREPWLEVRVTSRRVEVEAVPSTPLELADLAELPRVLEQIRTSHERDIGEPVDVLVAPDIDAQRLVDVLVALDTAGAEAIGMGPMPDDDELGRRGRRLATTRPGQISAQGDLDKALIRHVVKWNIWSIHACYTRALVDAPTLSGMVHVQFFIRPDGAVATTAAVGVDPEVASCVAQIIAGLRFPRPGGGGGVQVNYPFTFRT